MSKFSGTVVSTTENLQDSDCEMLDASDKMMNAFASAVHTEKPKGVSAELLENIWRIDPETAKRTIRTKTQLNRQDINSELTRNFGTNNRMLRYRIIK